VVLHWISTFGLAEVTEYKEEEQDSLWTFLSQFVRDNFNPAAFSDVFSSGGGIPEWLQALIQFPEGRKLVYDLTDQHRNCLFLNFAVHHILQQGYDKEVAAVGGSISGNFNVFNRLFVRKIKELHSCASEKKESILSQLFQMCCTDEIKYTYSRLILAAAFDTPYGTFFRQFSAKLEAYAAKNTQAWKMKSLFLSGSEYNPKNIEAAFCISSILRSSTVVLGDVQKLNRMYKEGDTPSVELLRCPALKEKLLRDLFAPKRKLGEQHRLHIVEVIRRTVVSEMAGSSQPADSEEIGAAIEQAMACVAGVTSGVKIAEVSLDFLDTPVAAMGVYQWLKVKLTGEESEDFFESGTSALPAIDKLMSEIMHRQAPLRADLLDVICETLPLVGNSLPAFSKQMMDSATIVLIHGEAELFSAFSKKLAKQKFDRSLIRHLVLKVLSMVGPPYSGLFASTLLRLITAGGHERISGEDRRSKLLPFLAACELIEFKANALGPKEEALLASMKAG